MFSWFDASKAKQFGAELAVYIIGEHVKPQSKNPRKSENQAARLRDGLGHRIERFSVGTPLNIYKQAQLANVLKWKLREAGLTDPAVDELTRFVMLRLRSAQVVQKPR